jgi:hypothetical protein
MKIIVMIDEANGNETIGHMWTETYIYDGKTPIEKIFEDHFTYRTDKSICVNRTIRLQVGEER